MFSAGRYRVNTVGTHDVKRGNVFLMDFAVGIRPMLAGYYQPDLVLMAEVNGQLFGDGEVAGSPQVDDGPDDHYWAAHLVCRGLVEPALATDL